MSENILLIETSIDAISDPNIKHTLLQSLTSKQDELESYRGQKLSSSI